MKDGDQGSGSRIGIKDRDQGCFLSFFRIKIRINSRTFLAHSALVIPASGTNKVPNSGLSPKWDQNAKMVPKSPDFAHNSQISDFNFRCC